MDLGLKGKRALVLGSTKGLGRGIVDALAEEGAIVALTGRKLEDATTAAAEVAAKFGATCYGLQFDSLDAASAAAVVLAAKDALGDVDILVLNSGGPPPGNISAVGSEIWQQQFQAQFLSFVEITNALLPGMRERKWGRILASSSSGVVIPIPNIGISNSLRSSLLAWAKTLSLEVAPDGVTVNTILPGRIQTDRLDQIDAANAERSGQTLDQIRAASTAAIPVGRVGTPEDYGAMAAFLCSEKAGYVTGSTVRVDGGTIRAI
jgi:3-oxoacyl-[acyl-carrier protein] reductase